MNREERMRRVDWLYEVIRAWMVEQAAPREVVWALDTLVYYSGQKNSPQRTLRAQRRIKIGKEGIDS